MLYNLDPILNFRFSRMRIKKYILDLLSSWTICTYSRLQVKLCKVSPAVQTPYRAAWKIGCDLHSQWHSI